MPKDFNCFDHGTGPIILDTKKSGYDALHVRIARPIELHFKANGAKDNGPSICIVMTDLISMTAGEISIKMLNEGLKDIGYELKKI